MKVRTFRSLFTVMTVAVVALAMSASVAFAQYPPARDFGVVCTPQPPAPGQAVSCEIVGAQASEQLAATASVDGAVFHSETLTADADGEADFGFTAPDAGDVVVRVVGAESGETSTVLAVSDEADAAEEGDAVAAPVSRLPLTGGQVLVLTTLGLLMLGGGLLALRRREDAKVSATA
jgi:LPXTG-motif cell wall-anchored protein